MPLGPGRHLLLLAALLGGLAARAQAPTPAAAPTLLPKDAAIAAARTALGKLFPVPADAPVEVLKAATRPADSWRLRVSLPLPAGWWARGPSAELVVLSPTDVQAEVWRDDLSGGGAPPPGPKAIAARFLEPPTPLPKEPARAMALLQRWQELYRFDPEANVREGFVFESLARACVAAERPDDFRTWMQAERDRQRTPYCRFQVQAALARWHEARREHDAAAAAWAQGGKDIAREAADPRLALLSLNYGGSDFIYSTLAATAQLEHAKALARAGRVEAAEAAFLTYRRTTIGQQAYYNIVPLLGDLYENKGLWDKAEKLYVEATTNPPEPFNMASYIKTYSPPIALRLKLLRLRRPCAAGGEAPVLDATTTLAGYLNRPPLTPCMAIALAREAYAELIPLPADAPATAEPDATKTNYLVRFGVPYPAGYWGPTAQPEALVPLAGSAATVQAYADAASGNKQPEPTVIATRFLKPPGGLAPESERALALIGRWLDTHRDLRRSFDAPYQALADAHRVAAGTDGMVAGLEEEARRTINPWGRAALHTILARHFQEGKDYDRAAAAWMRARDAMLQTSNSSLAASADAILLSLATLYQTTVKDLGRTRKFYEEYLNTAAARADPYTITSKLGVVYEQQEDWPAANALYKRLLTSPPPKGYGAAAVESNRKAFQARLDAVQGKLLAAEAAARQPAPAAAPAPK